jgi:hypothetical protein
MRYYSATFFCDKKEGPKAHISESKGDAWPISVTVNREHDSKYSTPAIVIHMMSHTDLFYFVGSVNKAYQDYLKG